MSSEPFSGPRRRQLRNHRQPAGPDTDGKEHAMITSPRALSHRDRAVLRAVRAGRCQVSGRAATLLVIDGVGCSDQFVAGRLVQAGLIASPGPRPAPARLTTSGIAMLEEAGAA